MTRTIAYCTLLVSLGVVLSVSAAAPYALSDANTFLKGFVTHEFLGVLFVLVSITLASISQLHLTFNRMEREAGRRFLIRTRRGVHQAAYFLIALLVAGIVIVVAKPMVALAPWSEALLNGFALIILLWNILLLVSITQAVFAIGPEAPAD